MNRKSVIRAFARERKRPRHKPPAKVGRPKVCTAETDTALAWVWEQYECPSAERLHPEIPEAVRIFQRDNIYKGQFFTKLQRATRDSPLLQRLQRTVP